MTEFAMKPKNIFYIKILLKRLFSKVKIVEEKKLPNFFAKIIVDLMGAAFQKTKTLPNFIINYIIIHFLNLGNAISLHQKRPFYRFLTQNLFLA